MSDTVHQVLQLPPNAIVLVQLGSRETGWVPGPEVEEATRQRWNSALARADRDDVTVMITSVFEEVTVVEGSSS